MFGSRRLEQNAIKVIPAGAFSPYKKLRRMWVDDEIHALRTAYRNAVFQPRLWLFVSTSLFNFSCFSLALSLSRSLPLCLLFPFFFLSFVLHRDLSNNQISELASDAFQGLRSLNSLWVHVICLYFRRSIYTKTPQISPFCLSWGISNVLLFQNLFSPP